MNDVTIVNRNFIITLLDRYLSEDISINEVGNIASDILFLDDDEKYCIDKKSEVLIIELLHCLEGASSNTWSRLNKADLKLLQRSIIKFIDDKKLLRFLPVVKISGILAELIDQFLLKETSEQEITKEVEKWNLDTSLKEKIIKLFGNTKLIKLRDALKNSNQNIIYKLLFDN